MTDEQKQPPGRINARLPRELHKELKMLAVREDTTVQALVERYVMDGMARARKREAKAA